MKKTALIAAVAGGLLALSGCDVNKTQEGNVTLPKYEKTQEGNVTLPKYDVKGPEVTVGTVEKTVTVPTITTTEKKVDVPTISVTPANETAKK